MNVTCRAGWLAISGAGCGEWDSLTLSLLTADSYSKGSLQGREPSLLLNYFVFQIDCWLVLGSIWNRMVGPGWWPTTYRDVL